MLGWLEALPDELFHVRPVLSVHFAGTLLQSGQLDGVEARLRDAERWLDTTAEIGEQPEASSAEMVVMDEEDLRRLPGSIAIFRAGQALALGDVPKTVTYARRALGLVPEDDHFWRGAAAALLGLAYWTRGDLEAGHRSYAEGMAHLQTVGNIPDAIGCAIALADIRIAQGRLREAMSTYEHALQLATEQGEPLLRGAADMYVGMSQLYRERNDLDAATRQLLRSKELGEFAGLPQNRYRWCVAMARIREAQGDLDGALDLLDDAERLYVSDFFPNVRPVSALKTGVWVRQSRLTEAATHGIMPDCTAKLLAVFAGEEQKSADGSRLPHAPPSQSLIEPLSQRELEVLRLIAQSLSNREIGERLFLALITVKGHNRNIFRKLQVRRRTEAVARARELGLL